MASEDNMSQLYAPAPSVLTPDDKVTSFGDDEIVARHGVEPAERIDKVENICVEKDSDEVLKAMEAHQEQYTANQERLITAIDSTSKVVTELRQFSKDRWIIHYPEVTKSIESTNGSSHTTEDAHFEKEHAAQHHPGLQRSATYQPSAVGSTNPTLLRKPAHRADTARDMSVLKLELKVGPANKSPSALLHSLEKSSIAQLLDSRFASSLAQLNNLRERVSDKQSKVLVTGDLNSGKSTYVNALLRRRVMPTDQQPCTTVFCEVLDAESNEGREEVHMLQKGVTYNINDEDTYTLHSLEDIEQIVADAEELGLEDAPVIKCYCSDMRTTQESLLHNSIVDIALIDAPGLNTDSVKTTNLFARQDEIDVVVFVVSAENHFTLSAKEFLWNASNDKAYVFVVVNKYDQIRNKERCRQRVLEQIRQLSPRTYEDAENLVHFVDSSSVAIATDNQDIQQSAPAPFAQMEAALRDFVLHKRSASKLQPAQTYLLKVLFDIAFLARTNLTVANREAEEAKEALAIARPALRKVESDAAKLEMQLEGEEDGVVGGITDGAKSRLTDAIDRVAKGEPADASVSLPPYPGFFSVWDYAKDVREAMLQGVEMAVRSVEDVARDCTKEAVDKIKALGEKHLPKDDNKKDERVFLPEVMFAKRRTQTSVAGLGLGPELVQVKISDLFDAKYHLMVITGTDEESKKDHDEEMSLVSSVSLGLGAMTLLGGKAFGAKTAVDVFVRVSDLAGNPTARRWALPVLVVASTGLVAWTIMDLPNSIPKNIGRSLAKELREGSGLKADNKVGGVNTASVPTGIAYTFAEIQSRRISRDSRKVLRLAGYDLSDRFRIAIAGRKQEVLEQEQKEQKAVMATKWLQSTGIQVGAIQKELESLEGINN